MKLEEKLVSRRKEKGLSQQAAAEKIGVSRQAISRWEVGAAVPSYENLKCICKLYGVSADFLIDDDREEIAAQATDLTPNFQEAEEPPKAAPEQNKRPRRRIGYATASCGNVKRVRLIFGNSSHILGNGYARTIYAFQLKFGRYYL
jgi:transcriptional regulator with XRE-family HTH domain